MGGTVIRQERTATLAATLCLWSAAVGAAAPWNVEDTGQPFVDAEFTVIEGSWMSVDVSPDGATLAFDLSR